MHLKRVHLLTSCQCVAQVLRRRRLQCLREPSQNCKAAAIQVTICVKPALEPSEWYTKPSSSTLQTVAPFKGPIAHGLSCWPCSIYEDTLGHKPGSHKKASWLSNTHAMHSANTCAASLQFTQARRRRCRMLQMCSIPATGRLGMCALLAEL